MTPPCVALSEAVDLIFIHSVSACCWQALEVIKTMNHIFALFGSRRRSGALARLSISSSALFSRRSFLRCGNYPDTSAG